ncbi:MAG: carbamoyl-phosphate synthase domain-containing protein, partial [Eggerthellaceae bacterium]
MVLSLTSKLLNNTLRGALPPAKLVLEDGSVFDGFACAAEGEVFGEVCFNTSLEGYLEVISDPS